MLVVGKLILSVSGKREPLLVPLAGPYTVCMNSSLYSQLTASQPVKEEPVWELVRVVIMRDNGARPLNFKIPTPSDDNTFVGRIRFNRADGGEYWRPAHFELRENVGNAPAHLRVPLFDPYLVQWLGGWQIFAGWEISVEGGVTHEHRQLWAISRDICN